MSRALADRAPAGQVKVTYSNGSGCRALALRSKPDETLAAVVAGMGAGSPWARATAAG
jgi:hypothetical protein